MPREKKNISYLKGDKCKQKQACLIRLSGLHLMFAPARRQCLSTG